MNRLKITPEINLGHIVLATAFLVTAMTWKVGLEKKISAEAERRASYDITLSGQIMQTNELLRGLQEEVLTQMTRTTAILETLQEEVDLNSRKRIADEQAGTSKDQEGRGSDEIQLRN